MTQYAGLCIGGPNAGKRAVSPTTKLRVEVRPPLKTMLEASVAEQPIPEFEIGTITYNWLHTGGLGLWIVEPMTMNDAIEAMALAYQEKHNG